MNKKATVAKFATVQNEGGRKVERQIEHYNLDVIISVGYRVKSQRGTQFRQWATQRLRDYLVKGYAINKNRLKVTQQQLVELKQTVKLLENVANQKTLTNDEVTGLLKVITDYTYALDVLDKYDHEKLTVEQISEDEVFQITYKEGIKAIKGLKQKFGGSNLFGHEKDNSFKSSLTTWGKYSSIWVNYKTKVFELYG
ncbi:RhuM family protein [Sinomicrobium sp. M5D2P17]